jgi:hypothetical protein
MSRSVVQAICNYRSRVSREDRKEKAAGLRPTMPKY